MPGRSPIVKATDATRQPGVKRRAMISGLPSRSVGISSMIARAPPSIVAVICGSSGMM
jgi:hypothetical protein